LIISNSDAVAYWVAEKTGGTWTPGRGTSIGRVKNGKIVGGIIYEDWNGANIMCHIAGEGNWLNRSFLHAIFHYPFVHLEAKRMTAVISSTNEKCIKLVENMGFELESRLYQATPDGDLLVYRMFKKDCRFLGYRYG